MIQKTEKNQLKVFLPQWLKEKNLSLKKSFCCLNPNHHDNHPSMSYNPKNHTVHCFSCGETYDIFQLVGMEEGIEQFSEQVKRVKERYELSHRKKKPVFSSYKGKNEGFEVEMLAENALEYQTQELFGWFALRGISKGIVQKHRCFCWKNRIVFPIWNETGFSWCARAISEDLRPRYKNSAGEIGIWGLDAALRQSEPVFVCEGILDALSIEECGGCAVALCGAANTGKLLRALGTASVELPPFVAVGDNDEAGGRMSKELAECIGCFVLRIPDGCNDPNDLLVKDKQHLKQLVEQAKQTIRKKEDNTEYILESLGQLQGKFWEYVERCRNSSVLSSGFSRLDELLGGGLFAGLYLLGAVSGLGKTTLLGQIADAVAQQGMDVLFFSLEMSRWELLAKSLCRAMGKNSTVSSREILQGNLSKQELKCNLEAYSRLCGDRIYLVDAELGLTAKQIAQAVEKHIECRRKRSVVIVDYLQILIPAEPKGSEKQNVDKAVMYFKRLSREWEIPVLVASSFNREAYSRAAALESFKESGGVEYTADVLLALQMEGMGTESFDIRQAKVQNPRRQELVVLKNRNGVPFGSVPMDYYARQNLFEQRQADTKELTGQSPNRIGRKR